MNRSLQRGAGCGIINPMSAFISIRGGTAVRPGVARRVAWASTLAVFALLVASACQRKTQQTVESVVKAGNRAAVIRVAAQNAQLFGTVYEITQRMLNRTENQLDAHQPGSDIAQLNRIGNSARIQVSYETFRLLDLAQQYSVLSGGAFDCSVAPLSYLWGFEGGPGPTNIPSADAIQAALLGVGARNVSLFDNTSAALTHTQARISVDSLIDAYAADMSLVEARDRTVANMSIQIGNNMRAIGAPNSGTAWEWALPDPFATNATMGTISLNTGGLSIVLLRDKTVQIGGRIYGHVINPHTGMPVTETAMAVVAGPSATKSCALAQALIVTGAEDAATILPRFAKCSALIIPDKQPPEIWMTRDFAPHVKLNGAVQQSVHFIEIGLAAQPVKDDDAANATNAIPASTPPAGK